VANGLTHKPLVNKIFEQLNQQGPDHLPKSGALAGMLRKHIEDRGMQFHLRAADAALFGSAAVEMWLKAVHSFLVSTSVMKASPVWSAVSGYYSSHYIMRAFSHLFGHFILGRDKQVVEMTLNRGYFCDTKKKNKLVEHQYYWALPHGEFGIVGNPLFSTNPPIKDDSERSDGFHRIYANYFDHVYRFPEFTPLDETFLKARVDRVSELVTDSPTVPDHAKFPDLDAVHVIAYARIVRFRDFLDDAIDPKNRFWGFYRKPSWFVKYMDFQVPGISTLSSDKILK
jgi:hypothetical protein